MSETYKSLSVIPDHSVDRETWEITRLEREQRGVWKKINYVLSNEDEKINHTARQVCGNYWEEIVRSLLREMIFNKNKKIDKNFDFLLKTWEFCENKTGRVWNVCVIIKDQLEKMPSAWFYSLVYYEIDWFKTASECLKYTKEHLKILPETYLKQKIKIKSIFIFPKSDIVWFYNKSNKIQRKIEWKKKKPRVFEYAPLKIGHTRKLFQENPWNHIQSHFYFWLNPKNSIEVFVSWMDVIL
jgi:hypothetical protein